MKTQINAYQITAKVEGRTWLSKTTVLTAENSEAAKEKAIKLLRLLPEHQISVSEITVFRPGTVLETDSYPYGYLKTRAFFSVEFNKKGFRTVFQTINPKTGRLNKPKNGTYSPVILPASNKGHHTFVGYLDFNGDAEINKGLQFMNDFKELFTEDQLKQINAFIYSMMLVSLKAQVIYCGSDIEDLKPLFTEKMKAAIKGDYLNAFLDVEKIEALKKPDFNPFAIKTYSI